MYFGLHWVKNEFRLTFLTSSTSSTQHTLQRQPRPIEPCTNNQTLQRGHVHRMSCHPCHLIYPTPMSDVTPTPLPCHAMPQVVVIKNSRESNGYSHPTWTKTEQLEYCSISGDKAFNRTCP